MNSDGQTPIFMIGWLVILALVAAVPLWSITRKAGYPGIYCIGFLIPYVNIVYFLWFAFSRWPVVEQNLLLKKEVEILRAPDPSPIEKK